MNFRLPRVLLLGLLLAMSAALAQAQDDYVRLQNPEKPSEYLNVESGKPAFGKVEPGWLSARWEMRQVNAAKRLYAFRNLWTGQYLSMTKDGKLTTAANLAIDSRTGTGVDLWLVERDSRNPSIAILTHSGTDKLMTLDRGLVRLELPAAPAKAPEFPKYDSTDYVRLQLTERPKQYLHVEQPEPAWGEAAPGWLSARWELQRVGQVYTLRSLWTGNFLILSGGKLTTVPQIKIDPRTGTGTGTWTVTRDDRDPSVATFRYGGATYMPLPTKSMVRIELPPEPEKAAAAVVYQRLRSATDPAVVVNNETGALAASRAEPGWYSAHWVVTENSTRGRFVTLKNRWTDNYLIDKDGKLTLGDAKSDPKTGRGPHHWQAVGHASDPSKLSLKNVLTGKYLVLAGGKLSLGSDASASAWRFETVK